MINFFFIEYRNFFFHTPQVNFMTDGQTYIKENKWQADKHKVTSKIMTKNKQKKNHISTWCLNSHISFFILLLHELLNANLWSLKNGNLISLMLFFTSPAQIYKKCQFLRWVFARAQPFLLNYLIHLTLPGNSGRAGVFV